MDFALLHVYTLPGGAVGVNISCIDFRKDIPVAAKRHRLQVLNMGIESWTVKLVIAGTLKNIQKLMEG